MAPKPVGKLLAPVAAVSLLLLVLAFGAAWYVRGLQRSVSDGMMNNVASVQAAQELEISIREIRTQFDRYLITLDRKHLEPVPRIRKRTADALAAVERAAATDAEFVAVRRVRTGYEHFFARYDDILRKPEQGLYPKIIELIDTLLGAEIFDPAHDYLKINEGQLARTAQANRDLADQLTTGLIAIGVLGAVGGLLGGTVLAVALRRSLLRAERQLDAAAAELDLATNRGRHREAGGPAGPPADAVERMTLSASAVLSRLRRTEKDALRAEQLAWVGQMAAGLAHEIRNPLMAIKILVQAVAERPGGPGFRPADLRVLEEEIVRLEQIVSGFLDFARPPRPEPRPVDVRELAERVADGVAARAELQGVAMHLDAATGPTVASADPNQVRQVLFNLLFNALEAQPLGGHIRIRVGAGSDPDGGPQLELRVEDGGPGLPADLGDRIFEPFVSTKETGLGLGLSICRRIAESHGGSLSAEAVPAGGSAFVLRLPLLPPAAPNGPPALAPPAESRDAEATHRR
jgi:signal transduction histidine kinase